MVLQPQKVRGLLKYRIPPKVILSWLSNSLEPVAFWMCRVITNYIGSVLTPSVVLHATSSVSAVFELHLRNAKFADLWWFRMQRKVLFSYMVGCVAISCNNNSVFVAMILYRNLRFEAG